MTGKIRTKELVNIALMIALICLGARISIKIFLVPFSLQPLMVMLASLCLKKGQGTLAVVLYVMMGLLGLPVFATGGGIAYIMKPSFGYLLGFIAMSWVIPVIRDALQERMGKAAAFAACLVGLVCLYGVALPYVLILYGSLAALSMDISKFLMSFCLIFLPSDVTSAVLVSLVTARLPQISSVKKHTAAVE